MTKICSKCNKELDESQFGNKGQCKDCWNAYKRAWRARTGHKEIKTPDQSRNDVLKSRYGLTIEQYNQILISQGGKCAACPARPVDGGRRFHVDHDHACCPGSKTCGLCVRGILCPSCNTTLGHAKDDAERLKNLVKYLEARRF